MEDLSEIYKKINKVEQRVKALEVTRPYLQDLVERNIKTNENLTETLHQMQMSMVSIDAKINNQSLSFEDFKHRIEDAHRKVEKHVGEIESKVERMEDKSSFDIATFLKKNFPVIIVLIGLGATVVAQYFKF